MSSAELVADQAVERALADTLPHVCGHTWKRAVFELARRLKAIPSVCDLPLRTIKPIVQDWRGQAGCVQESDDVWIEFTTAWEKVRMPADRTAFIPALARAKRDFPEEADTYTLDGLRLLVSLSYWLAESTPDGVFHLATREGAEALCCEPMTISRWFRAMVADGIVELVERGDFKGKRASRYRWLGKRGQFPQATADSIAPEPTDDVPF